MFGWAPLRRLTVFSPHAHARRRCRANKQRNLLKKAVPQGETVVRRLPVREPVDLPWRAAFDALPAAALLLGAGGLLLARNTAARDLLGPLAEPGARCCELLGCDPSGLAPASGCIAELALRTGRVGERQARLENGAAAWVSAAVLGTGDEVVLMLQPSDEAGAAAEAVPSGLCVRALGRTRLETDSEPVAGEWLGHRPGQLLKYLVCERGRVVTMEELLEVFWPNAGRSGATSVRQAIHTLRDRLEPARHKGESSAYVLARKGGYELAPGRVWIDADDFEARARTGLQALQRGAIERAEPSLSSAARAYAGDFLADEPYAEWALAERERLRDLAAQVLRGLAGIRLAAGDEESGAEHLLRLAELEPLDLAAQRELIALMLRRGRHSEALRRYELVRRRYRRTFACEPEFTLEEVLRDGA